ncbi:MAG: hypothetical protein ACR2KP_20375 [Egibacteraceae bacterium]
MTDPALLRRAALAYLRAGVRSRSPRDVVFAAGMVVGERRLRLGPDFPQAGPVVQPEWLTPLR